MARDRPTDRTVFQNAWVVPDLEAAIGRWVDQLGVGPFYVMVQDRLVDVTYRGAPSELSMRVALAQAGPVQIELIEQISDGPSAYRDSVPAGEMGFHHLCVWTHDIDADTEYFDSLGYPAATLGRSGARFGYFDTRPLMGCMLEVVEHQPRIEAMFGAIARAAVDWDGEAPIRTTADL
ncbi:MAG: VOC family protein [Actinomycetota bacterium]